MPLLRMEQGQLADPLSIPRPTAFEASEPGQWHGPKSPILCPGTVAWGWLKNELYFLIWAPTQCPA